MDGKYADLGAKVCEQQLSVSIYMYSFGPTVSFCFFPFAKCLVASVLSFFLPLWFSRPTSQQRNRTTHEKGAAQNLHLCATSINGTNLVIQNPSADDRPKDLSFDRKEGYIVTFKWTGETSLIVAFSNGSIIAMSNVGGDRETEFHGKRKERRGERERVGWERDTHKSKK